MTAKTVRRAQAQAATKHATLKNGDPDQIFCEGLNEQSPRLQCMRRGLCPHNVAKCKGSCRPCAGLHGKTGFGC